MGWMFSAWLPFSRYPTLGGFVLNHQGICSNYANLKGPPSYNML